MSKLQRAIHEIYRFEDIAQRSQWVNRIHPLAKFVLTVAYIALTVSFSKYDIIGLLGMAVYPFVMFQLAELSVRESLYRLRLVLPIVLVVGICNPFFDHTVLSIGGITVWGGVISMLTLMLKGIFSLLASYLLIATTTIEQLCYAFRMLHIPKILVTQILLTYRYITVLLEEVSRITQAYQLRAPNQNGIHFKAWGSLTGQLLLRSIDRANTVYESMLLRGYDADFSYVGEHRRICAQDMIYFIVWMLLLVMLRKIPVILWIGGLFV